MELLQTLQGLHIRPSSAKEKGRQQLSSNKINNKRLLLWQKNSVGPKHDSDGQKVYLSCVWAEFSCVRSCITAVLIIECSTWTTTMSWDKIACIIYAIRMWYKGHLYAYLQKLATHKTSNTNCTHQLSETTTMGWEGAVWNQIQVAKRTGGQVWSIFLLSNQCIK